MENDNRRVIDFSQHELTAFDGLTPEAKDFKATIDKMLQKFIVKNHDYGNSFAETVMELGAIAGFGQIMHKFNRLKTILKGEKPLVNDETVEDTLLDMANYCIMLYIVMNKQKSDV